jgi:hypothetical protein
MVGELLETKAARWAECRALCASRLREMASYFTGAKALTRVKQDDRMMQWFASLATEVRRLLLVPSTPLLICNLTCNPSDGPPSQVEAMSDGTEEGGGQHFTVLGRKISKTIT